MACSDLISITEMETAKLEAASLTEFVESTESTFTTPDGTTKKTVSGTIAEFDAQLASQVDAFQNRFALSDTPIAWSAGLLIEDELQLYSTGTKGESGYSVWLPDPTQLPFTTSATFSEDEELNRWRVANTITELQSISRSLNVLDSQVIYSTDTTTVLDGVLYIYDSVAQVVWGKPTNVEAGETIVSVSGDVLTTTGGSYTLLTINKQNGDLLAQDFGFKVDDPSAAAANTAIIESMVECAYNQGRAIRLPFGKKYLNSCSINRPVTILSGSPRYGSPISPNLHEGVNDIYHIGGGFCFDFIPINRDVVGNIADGAALHGLTFRGTSAGLGAWRVNDSSVIGSETYARRNFSASNVNVEGYTSSFGFEMHWTFTNQLDNVVVWSCAAPYYIRFAHATTHKGCTYENCSWGVLAVNTFQDNHYGSTIEGIRLLAGHTAPANYDVGGGYATAMEYVGWAVRVRGGTTNFFGGYMEANVKHYHTEVNSCINCIGVEAIQAVGAVGVENIAFGDGGVFNFKDGRINGMTTGELFAKGDVGICSQVDITNNTYIAGATRPATRPSISTAGVVDITNSDVADQNGFKRVYLSSAPSFSSGLYNGGDPIKVEHESIVTKLVYEGTSGEDRVIDLTTILPTATRMIAAFQFGNTTLTFTQSNVDNIKNGEELTLIAQSDGCTVEFDGPFKTKNVTETFTVNKTIIYRFVGLNSKWYQSGEPTVTPTA